MHIIFCQCRLSHSSSQAGLEVESIYIRNCQRVVADPILWNASELFHVNKYAFQIAKEVPARYTSPYHPTSSLIFTG